MSMTIPYWVTLGSAFGFGSIIKLILGWLRESWTNKRRTKSEATYLALRLAVILEEFVGKCVYRGLHDQANLTEGRIELDFNLPTLTCYPLDSQDWKSFHNHSSKLADQILSFQNYVASAGMSCHFQGMHEGNRIASADETIIAGIKAWNIAQELRKSYGLDTIIIDHIDLLHCANKKIQQEQKYYAVRLETGPASASIG
ncbi:hypothetical+protein [Methylocapsa aurea]